MGQVIYGASLYQSEANETDIRYDAIGDNSEAFTAGDPVTIESGGTLAVAGTTAATGIVGVAVKTQTMASNNETVAKVCPGYIPIRSNDIYLMGTTADAVVLTGPGTYYCLSAATTGTLQVDNAGANTGASRVVEVVKVDPQNIGGTGASSGLRQVLVRFVKTPYTNVTITA
jgi:hypothetical protein